MKISSKLSRFYKITAFLLLALIFIFINAKDCLSLDKTKPNTIALFGTEVNTYTGNLFYERTDLYIPGRGLSIDLTFSYNSGRTQNNWGFGFGWSFNYGMHYTIDGSSIIIERSDGEKDEFVWGGSSFIPPVGVYDELTEYVTDQYVLTTKHGLKYYFDDPAHKKLTSIKDRNNNTINLTYSANDLITITDPGGREVEIEYNPDGLISSITDPNTSPVRIYTYDYDVWGNMVKVTDPLGNEINYEYGMWYNMMGITNKNGNSVTISYNENQAVQYIECPVVDAKKAIEYDALNQITTVKDSIISGYQFTNYFFDMNERVNQIQLADGNSVFYNWNSQNNITTFIDPNGHSYTYTYDTKGNKLTETDPLGNVETFTYDPVFNFVLSNTNSLGNTTIYSYDGSGNLLNATDPLGNTISFIYNSNGNIINQTDANGNLSTYTYNSNGDLSIIFNAAGYISFYSYDPVGNRISETDANGNTISYEYDPLNRLVKITDAMGNINMYSYDPVGNRISETDANGNVTSYSYDALNRLIDITDALGNINTYSYDPVGNRISETDANGNVSTYSYDPLNRLIGGTDPLGYISTYSYDPVGNRISETDALGNSTSYSYDPLNRLINQTDALAYVSTYSYDPVGNRISETDANGNVTAYSYDPLNRLIGIIDPLGFTQSYTYDSNGNQTSLTNKNGNTTHYTYDQIHQLVSETNPLGGVKSYSYDPTGKRLTETDEMGNTTSYTYTCCRLISMSNPLGDTEFYNYDPNGNLISKTDMKGNITQYEYDGLNRIVKMIDALGNETNYTYDVNGNKLSETTPKGNVTSYEYDARNLMTRMTTPLGNQTQIVYDGNSNIIEEIKPDGSSKNNTYDAINRVATTTYTSDNVDIAYTYDANANVTGIVTTTLTDIGTIAKVYNARNELISITNDFNGHFTKGILYGYDGVGNRISMTADGGVSSYTFDANNRMISIENKLSEVTTYEYDVTGRRTKKTYANGMYATNSYDMAGNLLSLNYYYLNDDPLASFDYTYDNNGNKTYVSEIIPSQIGTDTTSREYVYDALNQLVNENVINGALTEYYYDEDRNRTIKDVGGMVTNYNYDSDGQLLSASSIANTWDNNGNLISTIDGLETTLFSYYYPNKLKEVVLPNGDTVSYDWTGEWHRMGKTASPTMFTLTDCQFCPICCDCHENAVGQYNDAGVEQTHITMGYHHDEVISQQFWGLSYFSITDALGSIRSIIDEWDNIMARYDYDAFGVATRDEDEFGGLNSYKYTGRIYDSEYEQYYYRARNYNPLTGRFTTRDPLWLFNLFYRTSGSCSFDRTELPYVYVENNPVNYMDPSGLKVDCACIGLTGVAVAGISVSFCACSDECGNYARFFDFSVRIGVELGAGMVGKQKIEGKVEDFMEFALDLTKEQSDVSIGGGPFVIGFDSNGTLTFGFGMGLKVGISQGLGSASLIVDKDYSHKYPCFATKMLGYKTITLPDGAERVGPGGSCVAHH